MGEETKVEKMFLSLEDGQGVVWEGIKDIQVTECIEHDYYDDTVVVPTITLIGDREASFTAVEVKYPKFWRCKSRKRFKKLMMSIGFSRNQVDQYLMFADAMRALGEDCFPSYQQTWNANRLYVCGI